MSPKLAPPRFARRIVSPLSFVETTHVSVAPPHATVNVIVDPFLTPKSYFTPSVKSLSFSVPRTKPVGAVVLDFVSETSPSMSMLSPSAGSSKGQPRMPSNVVRLSVVLNEADSPRSAIAPRFAGSGLGNHSESSASTTSCSVFPWPSGSRPPLKSQPLVALS